MKLKKEALKEILFLQNEVKEVVKLLTEFGINITSDTWRATSFSDKEDILNWKEEDFQKFENISYNDTFFIGGNLTTGHQHKYKNEYINAPEELAEIEGKIFKKYLEAIIILNTFEYFELKLNDCGLIDNCGWEHFISIDATVKESALEKNILKKQNITLEDLNKYAEERNIDKKELRIFICRNIPKLQKEDSKIPIYAEIDNDNDLRIIVTNKQWAFARKNAKIPLQE